ncbi:hypothetical protein OSB04_015820 [Centaurea solstitialis]|uniref:Retrotransposon protein, putative, Ty1-copia subclass n=1 Tax=Centaurea solstitialis TaxID=347529 RepID=A0AA38SZR8_9ASTR|nr:hypothetical protein OSB04_015820 [Centaurea solstitialis]
MSPISIPFYSPEESLRLITGKWKLTSQNFPVWKLHLQNVLSAQGKLYVINKPMSRPKSNAPEEEFAEYFRFMADELDVMSIIVFSMSPEFTGDLRVKFCHEVVRNVENQLGFYKHTGKLLIMQEILSLKLQKGQSVKNHLIEMRRLFKCLSRLGYKMTQEELVYLMWFSLTKEVQDTASAYMKEPKNDVDKVHEDILASLEPAPEPANLMDTDIIDELGDLSCPECGSEDICEHSMNIDQIEIGLPDAPGIFIIDCLITSYESWVIDTGSGNHICNHLQGFTRRKTLRKDRSNLRVGEGTPLIAEAVGSYSLSLPSGLVLELDNCYYIPNMIKNVLSFDLLVDQDVCGPFSHVARGGYRYFITFTDDFSRYGYVYLMRHKSETFEKFKEYQNEVQNLLDKRIKFLRSDRGGEYLSDEFDNHLMECGIVSQLTPPYTPQMNGVSERRNRTLLDMMANTVTNTNNLSLRSILEKDKLTGPNFLDWERNLQIVLRHERKWYVLEEPLGEAPPANASTAIRNAYQKHSDDLLDVGCLMLATMSPELQTGLMNTNAYDMIRQLRDMFQTQARTERYDATRALNACKMAKGTSVSAHVMKMKRLLDHLERLGHPVPLQLATDTILNSLSDDYKQFVMNFNMNNMERSIAELHSMLKTVEQSMGTGTKTKDVLMVRDGGVKKKRGQRNTSKGKDQVQVSQSVPKAVDNRKGKGKGKKVKVNKAKAENRCFTCHEVGHWRHNCPKRHETGTFYHLPGYKGAYNLVVDEESTTPVVEPEIQHNNVEPQSEPIEEVQTQDLRRSSRIRQEPDRYLGFLVSQDSGDLNEPTSYGEVVSGSESEQWQEAMKAEMQSMYDNQVWELTDLPQHCKAVGRKWVFKKKTDMDGNVHTFKARLVAKGFTQTHGIDYDETFSPVAMLKSIRILMAISAYFNYEIWQMDVKTAFLNGKLTEDVYMEQPEGFEDPKNPNKMCKLLKSIYGLKQASRSWNLHFDERIKEFGFTKSEFEPCVYTKFSGSIVTFLVLYVDDILLIGNDVPTLQSVESWLSKCFQMKDLGEAAYILGIKIYRNRSKRLIGLSQSTYIDKILKKFRMDESKKGFIPMQHGIVLSKTQCPVSSQDQDKMKSVPYASAIGSIMYAMLCTRPDVAYSVSVTSRYQQNPGEPHWVAVKNILKYLRRTKEMFLVFGGTEDEISVTGYSDASFQTDRDDFRSQSVYVFTLNAGAISWKSSKQDTIADSTTEAEYIAASDAAKEAVWLRNFLLDLRVVASISRPIDIFCDNSGAVAQAKEPREHHKSRHVLRKYHLIREIIGRGDVRICKIPTEDNVADPLTKPLARVKHEAHANSIGMQYLEASS